MKARLFVLFYISILSITIHPASRAYIKGFLYPLGVAEGHYLISGHGVTTFYGEETVLYFRMGLFNVSHEEFLDIDDWEKTLEITKFYKRQFSRENPEGIIMKDLKISPTLNIAGLLERPKDPKRQPTYFPVLRPNKSIPNRLCPRQEVNILLAVELEESLPAADYGIYIDCSIGQRKIGTGTIFRIRPVRCDDDRANLQKMKAYFFRLRNEPELERKALKKSLVLAPGSPLSWFYLGSYLEDIDEYQKALEVYKEGQRKFPCSKEQREKWKGSNPFIDGGVVEDDKAMVFRKPCFEDLIHAIEKLIEAKQ